MTPAELFFWRHRLAKLQKFFGMPAGPYVAASVSGGGSKRARRTTPRQAAAHSSGGGGGGGGRSRGGGGAGPWCFQTKRILNTSVLCFFSEDGLSVSVFYLYALPKAHVQ